MGDVSLCEMLGYMRGISMLLDLHQGPGYIRIGMQHYLLVATATLVSAAPIAL